MYDVTEYNIHPAGKLVFEDVAGEDATEEFVDEGHSNFAKEEMKQFCIGVLKDPEEETIDTSNIKSTLKFDST